MRTQGQKRANFALTKVLDTKKIPKFKNFSAGAPSMILKNGFGQTLAFWVAKGKGEHIRMFDIIVEWLSYKKDDVANSFAKSTNKTEFLKEISKMSQNQYLLCQQETLKLLEWVKRFANAKLGEQNSESEIKAIKNK